MVGKSSAENKLSNKTKIATIGALVGERNCGIWCLHDSLTYAHSLKLFCFFVVLQKLYYKVSENPFLKSTFSQLSSNSCVKLLKKSNTWVLKVELNYLAAHYLIRI